MDIRKWNENLIAFDFDTEMVNATDMIKSFPEKRVNNFLRNQQTIDFIEVLDQKLNTRKSVIKETGRYGGTYMHKLLAYKFAAWLNPRFELFVFGIFDDSIKERIYSQQRQLDYFWDKQDQNDIYNK